MKPVTIRLILSMGLSSGWSIKQLDVKTPLLHGHLHEDVYMIQPPRFTHPDFPKHVYRLRKTIYGLKQAPHAWFQQFSTSLIRFDFLLISANPSLFIYNKGVNIVNLIFYVDDIIIIGNCS